MLVSLLVVFSLLLIVALVCHGKREKCEPANRHVWNGRVELAATGAAIALIGITAALAVMLSKHPLIGALAAIVSLGLTLMLLRPFMNRWGYMLPEGAKPAGVSRKKLVGGELGDIKPPA